MRKLLLLLSLLTIAPCAWADREVSRPFQTAVSRGHVQKVIIDIPAGEIRIRNGARDRLTASGRVTRSYDSRSDRDRAQRIVDDTEVAIEVRGDLAVVTRHLGDTASTWRGRTFTAINAELEVPAGVTLEFTTHYGEVHLDGVFGDVDVDLRAGEVHFTSPRRSVGELNASVRVGEVHTDLGDRVIDREGVFPGQTTWVNAGGAKTRVSLHTTAGEVHVRLTP